MRTEEQSIEYLVNDLKEYAEIIHGLCVKISNKQELTDVDYVNLANTRSIICNTMAFISSKFLNSICRNGCAASQRDRCLGYYGRDTPRCEYYAARTENGIVR